MKCSVSVVRKSARAPADFQSRGEVKTISFTAALGQVGRENGREIEPRQDKTGQDRVRQDKTRTRQDKIIEESGPADFQSRGISKLFRSRQLQKSIKNLSKINQKSTKNRFWMGS